MKLSELGLMSSADTLDNTHRLVSLSPDCDYDEPIITLDEFAAQIGDGPLIREFVYDSNVQRLAGSKNILTSATTTKWLIDLLMYRMYSQIKKTKGGGPATA